MLKRTASGITLAFVLLVGISTLVFNIQPVEGESGIIYIRANGSIEPSWANITTSDHVTYTFTGDINNSIVVERSNIIIDGNGYSLQGFWSTYLCGFSLTRVSNVTIKNTSIEGFDYDIYLDSTSLSVLSGNDITASQYACIALWNSSRVRIEGNSIESIYGYGVELDNSSMNTVSMNNVSTTFLDVYLFGSSNNTITQNSLTEGLGVVDSYRNIVAGNSVNGKPLVYLENASGYVVSDAGQVVLVDCSDVIVKDLELCNVYLAIELWGTNYTKIVQNRITNNDGLGMLGILLGESSDNTVAGNSINASSFCGIELWSSSNNSIVENNITNCYYGIYFYDSPNNTFCHNSFVNNTVHVYVSDYSMNQWDNGFEGNYWSDYRQRYPSAAEIGDSGIWDTPYVIDADNRDSYPLMSAYIPGDYNHDGEVNMTDVELVRAAWQSREGEVNYNPHVDFNMDGIINIKDASIIGVYWKRRA